MDRELAMFLLIMALVVALVVLGILCINCLAQKMSFSAIRAEIEQVRLAAQKADVSTSEDIMGKVVDWNQRIASNQAYNKLWWADLFVPDEWNDVPLIEVR